MPRKKRAGIKQVFDSVKTLVIEGVQLYRKITLNRKANKQNDNGKIQDQRD